MASARFQSPPPAPLAGVGRSLPPVPVDEDDGIHIASVTRIEGSGASVLRVVVAWIEEGRWVERTVELADETEPRRAGPETRELPAAS